jgi:hypothetical protein
LEQDIAIATPEDVASNFYSSDANGWNTCGDRTYTIVDSTGATPTWVTAVNEAAVVDGDGVT